MCVNSAVITDAVDPYASVNGIVSGLNEMNVCPNPHKGKFRIIFSFTEEKEFRLVTHLHK
jgi:hypothetical protein